MPFSIRKLPKQNKYKVFNKITGKIHAYHSTRENAVKQLRLLNSTIFRKNGVKNSNDWGEGGHNPLGEGVFSDAFDKVKDIGTKLIHGRNDYPPSVKTIINKFKDEKIVGVSLRRKELISLYGKILNAVTKNEFQKRLAEEPKDKLFHISIWITLSNGKTILAEKNEVINMVINPKSVKEQQQQNASIPSNTSFMEFFEKARQQVGDGKFFGYSAKDNNCGNWIEYLLKANGIDSQATHDFIGQDAKKLLDGFPTIRKVMNTLTDVAGRANVLVEGGKINKKAQYVRYLVGNNKIDLTKIKNPSKYLISKYTKKPTVLSMVSDIEKRINYKETMSRIQANKKRLKELMETEGDGSIFRKNGVKNSNDRGEGGHIPIDNGLNSKDIINILKHQDYNINGVFSKDLLPKELTDGWYVINLQSSNEGDEKGSHWTCFKKVGDNAEYFDAFGFIFPNEVREKIKGHILYSKKEIQDYYSTTCGWFCIGAIVSDNGFGNYQSHFNKYLNMFSSNTRLNDEILSDYLTKKGLQ